MTKSAASDEVVSVSDLLAMAGTARATGKSFHTVVDSVSRRVMDNVGQDPWEAVPMILVKHRWMRGRSTVANCTILAFEMDGIARVRDAGNARTDVENYVRTSRGVAEILTITDPAVRVEDPMTVAPPTPVVQSLDVQEPEESQEVAEDEIQTSAAEVAESETVSEDAIQEPIKKKPPTKGRRP